MKCANELMQWKSANGVLLVSGNVVCGGVCDNEIYICVCVYMCICINVCNYVCICAIIE